MYIDDIFLIWTGSLSELKCFYRHCNSLHKTIKFTIEYSEKQVSFLDTLVIRTEDGHILFDLFSKPTDKHCYLHYTSNHPDKLKISGPYSQFLRLKRICTRPADFEKHASNLVTFYERRNYPKHVIMENLQKARAQDRKSLLKPPPTTTETTDRIPLVLTYNKGIIPLSRAIYKIWPIIQINNQEQLLLRSPPLLANKVGQKISNQLIRAEFTSTHSGKTGKTYLKGQSLEQQNSYRTAIKPIWQVGWAYNLTAQLSV